MWTCGELKKRAWGNLKKYYWMAFLVCIIAGLLGGMGSGGGGGSIGGGSAGRSSESVISSEGQDSSLPDSGTIYQEIQSEVDDIDWEILLPVILIVAGVIVVAWAIAVAWGAFMGNPIRVGACRFFLESRELGASAGVGRLFYVFNKANYLNVVKVMFMRGLFTFLWSLLLIIPGIIKSYQYAMVPYILSDNPNMNYKEALATSKAMMHGHKFHLWVLHLSFIGWHLLGLLCCCIGGIFVTPYVEATIAELYVELRSYPLEDAGLML